MLGSTTEVGLARIGEQDLHRIDRRDHAHRPADHQQRIVLGVGHLQGLSQLRTEAVAVCVRLHLADERGEVARHLVDGVGQGADLVVASDRNSCCQVTSGDAARHRTEAIERTHQ